MQDAGPVCLRCAGLDHLVFRWPKRSSDAPPRQ